ncbi:uncharacterized protein LOC126550344 isoform X1 [Aphis gossypii]|uniref:uncharacterized protein LOC126550344 isoform X1 n=1 Tax=Aphis gossypii TaxID=80765 RepID=UPI0021590605|nr:uncharacterized protein LOC126550344 isoform X1 [Aphis gossypii]
MAESKGDAPENRITIKVECSIVGHYDTVVYISIKKTSKLQKLMNAYCERTTFLKSENMTHSPVPCRRYLFNSSPDDITIPDVDYSDEMESQLCVENTNEEDEVKKLLEKCQTENIRLNSQS